jgi:ribose transport system substrate-binding protein
LRLGANGAKPQAAGKLLEPLAMRHTCHHALVYFLCTVLAVGGGCRSASRAARYRIVVVPKGTSHDFWKSIHAGAEKAGKEHGGVQIIWEGPAREDQRQEQQNIVERFTSEGVSAIVLAPTDRQTLVAPVEAALKQGIPVVIIDSGLEESPAIKSSSKYLGYVATDNREGGRKAAERMAEVLKGKTKAKVLLLRYQAGSESTEQREAGFIEKIKSYPNLELIVPEDEAGATVDTGQKAAERVLSNHPDLDGIFTPNESSSTGMLQALRGLQRLGQVKFIGFDGSEILIRALRAGELQGLVLQDPFDMGYRGVWRALDALEGRPPRELVQHTNLQVATRENVDTPEIRRLYAP